jgi:hypothetical protein
MYRSNSGNCVAHWNCRLIEQMDNQMDLSYVQQRILVECFQRTDKLAKQESPTSSNALAYRLWRDESEYGPVYSCRQWIGPVTDAERMRCQRAVRAIKGLGLVEVTRFEAEHTRAVVHLQLTALGESVARQLTDSEDQPSD